MLGIVGGLDSDSVAELLVMLGLAPYVIAVLIAIGLWLWSFVNGRRAEPDMFESERLKETRALVLISLAPLPVLLFAPRLTVFHPLAAIVSLIVLLLIAALVFRQMLRYASGTA